MCVYSYESLINYGSDSNITIPGALVCWGRSGLALANHMLAVAVTMKVNTNFNDMII